jgi:hypothetical protein
MGRSFFSGKPRILARPALFLVCALQLENSIRTLSGKARIPARSQSESNRLCAATLLVFHLPNPHELSRHFYHDLLRLADG